MREQEATAVGQVAGPGRRHQGAARRRAPGRGAPTQGAVGVSSAKASDAAAAGGGEERKAVVRVVAADMPPALQRRAFRCARDELAAMPHFPRRLEPKRLALALKKVSSDHDPAIDGHAKITSERARARAAASTNGMTWFFPFGKFHFLVANCII
jgi:hypothetical protein